MPDVRRVWLVLAFLSVAGSVGGAAAQTVPTKTITFYNNSARETLYPVIQAPIMTGKDVRDLWMQAQFNVPDVSSQIFNTTLLYRIYINRTNGLPPHSSVTITLPFYTQLLPADAGNLGKVDDQFIDWWNAMRIFLFDGKNALNAAFDYSVDATGKVIPPPPINPVPDAALPSCAATGITCDPLVIVSYVNGFPSSVPAQLVEYTFASALASPLSIDLGRVNYNISGVDQVYLPAAIGAKGNGTAENTYLGSTQRVPAFRTALRLFNAQGSRWPYYVPAYYTAQNPTVPLPSPPPGVGAYPLPQIPSTNVVYAESFNDPPPAPPVLSSDTPGNIGMLGTLAQGTLNLWETCTSAINPDATCQKIQLVRTFFVSDYNQCFPGKPLPAVEEFLRDVYGWVQFSGCSTPLAQAPGYDEAVQVYCDLQYNFFDPAVPPDEIFNPYVRLIHQTLASNAYAFSIDDAVSFKSVPGTGIIVTVAGPNGLENQSQTPLPTATTYRTYCQGSSTLGSTLGSTGEARRRRARDLRPHD